MNYFKVLSVFLMLLTSCGTVPTIKPNTVSKTDKYKFVVMNWTTTGYSSIYCDSVKMTSLITANLWVDGCLITIISEKRITISTNN